VRRGEAQFLERASLLQTRYALAHELNDPRSVLMRARPFTSVPSGVRPWPRETRHRSAKPRSPSRTRRSRNSFQFSMEFRP
jgi:hypothetical protein